jgi:hypothetical protein
VAAIADIERGLEDLKKKELADLEEWLGAPPEEFVDTLLPLLATAPAASDLFV